MEQSTFFSIFFLAFMATAIAMAMARSPPASTTTTTQKYTNFVKTSCNVTTYPSVCLTSLLPYATTTVKSNPLRLVKQALSTTLKSASATRSTVSKLAKSKNISKGDAAVLRDCMAEIKDAMEEITHSLKAISSIGSSANKKFAISNAQTWASAAITDEYTCLDELAEVKVSPAMKKKIRNSFVKIARQSSNALYLINHLYI